MSKNVKALALFVALLATLPAFAQEEPTEDDYYPVATFPLPDDVVLEASGLGWLDDKQERLLVCTRRGELWVLDNVYAEQPAYEGQTVKAKNEEGKTVDQPAAEENIVRYTRMLFGLHEPLGLVVDPGHGFPEGIYMAQRGELTRVEDTNGDDRIDVVENFCSEWEISGSYHEYAFGPKLGKDGRLWITLNRPFGGGQEGGAHWRSWAVAVDSEGEMHPVCTGLRSPAGLGTNCDNEMFYTDNQGDHVAVCKLSHMKPGSFHGNPIGLESVDQPKSNFKIPFNDYPKRDMYWGEAVQENPHLQPPAVWFPYPEMGKSHTDVLCDDTGGKFGPFAGQTFVGDLSTSQVLRVYMEKIDGEYQGAVFPFRKNIGSAVLRMHWGKDGSMFVGGSNRGWGGSGKSYGLHRIDFSGEVPFEILKMEAQPDGFLLMFTQPVDPKTAGDAKSYRTKSWTYRYHKGYGDKPQDEKELEIKQAIVGKDGKSVRLVVSDLRPYYVHELQANGVRSSEDLPLLHAKAFYTLNRIPEK